MSNQSQSQQAQQWDMREQVNQRHLNSSHIVFSALSTLDMTGKVQKLKEILRSDQIPSNIQKALLMNCNIWSLEQVFEVRSGSKYIDLGLQIAVRVMQFKQDAQYSNVYMPKDSVRFTDKRIKTVRINQKWMNLKQLFLDNNLIESIDTRIIEQMRQLRKLSLYSNMIEVLPSFSANPNLTTVNARKNPIKTIMISPEKLYFKDIQIDWLDYVDTRTMQNSRFSDQSQFGLESLYRNHKQNKHDSHNKLNKLNKQNNHNNHHKSNNKLNKINENKLSNQFRQIIMQLKREKYGYEDKADIGIKEQGVNFTEFMGAYMRMKQFKEQFRLELIGYNLRVAMIGQFDQFIDYCMGVGCEIDFNQLRYKGNLVLEYALENEYQYGVNLFIQGLKRFKPSPQTIYNTMQLASKYSHLDLFQSTYSIVAALLHSNQLSGLSLNHLLQYMFKPDQISNKLTWDEYNVCGMQSGESLPQQNSVSSKDECEQTKFGNLISQTLLNFSLSKHSDLILKRLIQLYALYILSQDKGKQVNQKRKKDHPKYTFTHEDAFTIDIETPSQFSSKTLTKQSVQNYIHGIMYILQDEHMRRHFRIKQQTPYTKHKHLLQLAASTKNNQLLQHLLWNLNLNLLNRNLNLNLFNRNIYGRIPRNGRVLLNNKKLLYHKQIQLLQERFQFINSTKKFKNQQSQQSKGLNYQIQKKRHNSQIKDNRHIQEVANNLEYFQSYNQKLNQSGNQPSLNYNFNEIQMQQRGINQPNLLEDNLKKSKQKLPNYKKLKLSKDYHPSPTQRKQHTIFHKNLPPFQPNQQYTILRDNLPQSQPRKSTYLNQNQFQSLNIKKISDEIQKVKAKRKTIIQVYQNTVNKELDQQNILLHTQLNSQYELMHQILWHDLILSHLSSHEKAYDQDIIRNPKTNQTQPQVSILNNISKNILSCACVQLQPQYDNCIDVSVEPNHLKPSPKNNSSIPVGFQRSKLIGSSRIESFQSKDMKDFSGINRLQSQGMKDSSGIGGLKIKGLKGSSRMGGLQSERKLILPEARIILMKPFHQFPQQKPIFHS